jgi:subtilase family serine protease
VTDLKAAASVTPNTTFAENPGSLACVDGVIAAYSGCTYSGGFYLHPINGGGAIVIVDAYHNPDAASDLAAFNAEWGLPAVNFHQFYCQPYGGGTGTCNASNTPPATDTGWGLEIALDIEYAHAMAPKATIVLLEAATNSFADLTWAEAWGGYYADIYGGGEVSNSWGGSEFSGETGYDYFFNNFSGSYHPVVYVASGGDSGTIEYPSASPYVISAGGTTINRDASGNYLNQTCWSGTGRGTSAYETSPYAQGTIAGLGSSRQTNDLSSDADPNSGVWVYDALNGGWFVVGGTSVSAPTLAGILNNSANVMSTSALEQDLVYSEFVARKSYGSYFYDVTPTGYDQCTGIGVPKNLNGK